MENAYFEQMYAGSPDPWGLATRWYEQRKYAVTLGALRRPRYASVFEPGCSVGVLSTLLAERCDRLVSADLIPSAVDQTRRRLAALDRPDALEVRRWDAHGDWPDERFDLVVVSEMLYYLDPDDARRFMDQAAAHLADGGEVLLVHWRPKVPEYPLTGDQAHGIALATRGLEQVGHYEDDDFLLDVLAAPGAESVAAQEGLRDD